jgi:hypothetical protein
MEGRGAGTEGLDRAAHFIEQRFRELGLEATGGSYRQPFPLVTRAVLGKVNRLTIAGVPARLGSDFMPLRISAPGAFSGTAVFVGYGIRAPELGYDDYAGIDATGKLALAMRYEPGEEDAASPFDGARPSRWSDWSDKARAAHEAGAQALILISPPGDGAGAALPLFRPRGAPDRADLPVLQVDPTLIEHLLRRQGVDLANLRAAIDREYRPRSLELPSLELSGEVVVETAQTAVANVIGVRAGRGDLAGEVVVVGAHYDHLGSGGAGSHTPDIEAIHNGADDNASGVAAMVCGVAGGLRQLAGASGAQRALLLAAFAAGEYGLGGSSRYVREPPLPLASTVAMLNLDTLGHLREGRLHVRGSESAAEWLPLLARPAGELGLALVAEEAGSTRPSDQAPFQAMGIPAVQLSTGAHSEHRTPHDDPATLGHEGGARVATFVQQLVTELLTSSEKPLHPAATTSTTWFGDARSQGAYVGTTPDLAQIQNRTGGVPLAAVTAASPAEKAGLRAGDRIIGMAGIRIANIVDMTRVLKDHRPGEAMEIEVAREGQSLRFWAVLEPRRAFSP